MSNTCLTNGDVFKLGKSNLGSITINYLEYKAVTTDYSEDCLTLFYTEPETSGPPLTWRAAISLLI